jgi:ribosomal protein S18 acetylase RimI-like enzyme
MVNNVENLIKKNRASDVEFLYLWFFGVANEALGTSDGRDLMKFIFKMSADQKLPIYLETSLKRNNIIYKRYGFEDYNILKTGYGDLTMWYMMRPYEHQL